jgi:hypothetical protein
VAAQSLAALSGIDRQEMRQHVGGDTKRHQGSEMRAEPVRFPGRPTIRRPIDAGLDMTTADAAEPWEPQRHRTEHRRNLPEPPVIDMASTAAGRTDRPCRHERLGLLGNDRLLHAPQNLLAFGQRETKVFDISHVACETDFHHVDPICRGGSLRIDQSQNPAHPSPPGQYPMTGHIASKAIPPLSGHSPRELLIRQRTQTVNASRGLLAGFGISEPQRFWHVGRLRAHLDEDTVPRPGRAVLALSSSSSTDWMSKSTRWTPRFPIQTCSP